MGGPVVHAARHRRRARTPGPPAIELDVHATARRPPGGVPRRHGRPDDRRPPVPSPRSPATSCPALDNAYWWVARSRRDPRPRPTTTTRSGVGPPGTTASASPLLEEVLEEFPTTWCSTSTSSRPPRWSPPTRRPLADLLRRFDCADRVIVASFLDTATDALLGLRARVRRRRRAPLATADFYRAVQAGERPGARPGTWPSRCRPPSATSPWSTRRFVEVAHAAGPGRPRVDHRGGVRDGGAAAAWASTASSPTGPRRWSGSSTGWAAPGRHGEPPADRPARRGAGATGRGGRVTGDDGRERPRPVTRCGTGDGAWRPGPGGRRSAAPAVRLLAVVGLLLGPELALVGSLRHSPARLARSGRPGGQRGVRPGRRPAR